MKGQRIYRPRASYPVRMGMAALCALAVAAAATLPGRSAKAAFPGQNGKIAFDAIGAGGDRSIFVINPDGSGRTELTPGNFNEFEPAWSPDGTRIAFRRNVGPDTEIWVMNANGSGEAQVTSGNDDAEPAFSADGGTIFFRRSAGGFNIWSIDAGGVGAAKQLTTYGNDEEPTSSPDGQRIAFWRDVRPPDVPDFTYNHAIFVAQASDGTGQTLLTPTAPDADQVHAEGPNFSPDGSLLTFSRCTGADGEGCDVPEIVTRSSTDPSTASPMTEVTSDSGGAVADPWDLDPVFSPDGTRIAFQRGTDRNPPDSIGIFTVPSAGGPAQLLTFLNAQEANPDWQPILVAAQQPGAGGGGGAAGALKRGKRCRGVPVTITATNKSDVIKGTPKRDVIHGLKGRDRIYGLKGNDRLCGGRGKDRIFGGKGHDILFGGHHFDFLAGGPGRDRIFGGTPKAPIKLIPDICRGGRGHDFFRNCQKLIG